MQQACLIKYAPDVAVHLPVIYCQEKNYPNGVVSSFQVRWCGVIALLQPCCRDCYFTYRLYSSALLPIFMWPNMAISTPFVSARSHVLLHNAQGCVEAANLDWTSINTCYGAGAGKEGIALINANADFTGKVSPPHTFVPWVIGEC